MSLFNTLRTGASGLGVSGRGLAVIGDNIANMNTTGFKANRATFADALPQAISTLGGPSTLGSGAMTADVSATFSQGLLQGTGNALDMAIQGRGFFQVADGNQTYYTRDGSFGLDNDGFLVTSGGLNVQGYAAQNGQLGSAVENLQFDLTPVSPQVTSTVSLQMALSAETDFATTPFGNAAAAGLNGQPGDPTLSELSTLADFTTSVTVYDSLGVAHDVTVYYERTGASDWTWTAAVDGGSVDGAPAGSEDAALEVATGTLNFATDGSLAGFTQTNTAPVQWSGADPWNFDLQLGLDAAGDPTNGEIRMMDSESSVTFVTQNGYTSGSLSNVYVESDGTIRGTYTNGQEQVLGQVAVALFQAEGGLQREGNNLWAATDASGQAAVGAADTGGRGVLSGYGLERSNVELEDQFVLMIQGQRGYQANASVVRTADETLQELVNLV